MTRPAIIVSAITQWVEEARGMVAAVHEEETRCSALEIALNESRDRVRARHIELGAFLAKVHGGLPKRSKNGEGWMAFLEAIEINTSTAYRYMEMAGWVSDRADRSLFPNLGNSDAPDAPPPTDDDAPREVAVEAGVPQDEVEIDRDTWCTPKSLAEALGQWDLDPCSNERSHVQAKKTFTLESGEDGIVLAPTVKKNTRAFLNPPYSHVMPWVEAYAHTRFCFLLKFDCSTRWFEKLVGLCEVVLLPRRTRIQFEPPPGVPPEKAVANQFPHALFYARDEDVDDAIRDLCFPPWRIR